MKKIIFIGFVFFVLFSTIFTGCNPSAGGNPSDSENTSDNGSNNPVSSTEKFTKTVLFNPNSSKVKLMTSTTSAKKARAAGSSIDFICDVAPKEKKEIELGSEHVYFFSDSEGNKIADLSKGDDEQYSPVYLELNEPKDGREYLLLNQYKTDNILESFTRYNKDGSTYETYGLLLYEVVSAEDLDAYKYNDSTYIRIYPSANYWIDSQAYASNKIGTKITFDADFKNNLEALSDSWVAWGWSTNDKETDMWFCHRVVSYILHAKDGDTYQVKNNIEEQASISTTVQAIYSENPDWKERWVGDLPSTETTKWKVTEIWFYSTQKLYYVPEFYENGKKLEATLQEKISGCKLMLFPKDKETYEGWMPPYCKYALCVRLESKNCNVNDAWCETIETSVLKEVYETIIDSVQDFILNY